MKRIASVCTAFLFSAIGGAQAQSSIERVLKDIETNNRELQANRQWIASQKLDAETDNSLPDPALSYAHLWGAKDKSETIGELIVSQSFDFPVLYAERRKLNRLKAGAFDSRADVFRQEKLLQAKELCLDIIMLRRQKLILEERLRNAEELAKIYVKRLQTGDANVLETNKIHLELLNVKTEVSLNETALRSKQQELNVMNGNIQVIFEDSQYQEVPLPADYETLKSEVMAEDRTLTAFGKESLVARKQVAVSKSQWLPKLELGYRRNTETGMAFNGIVIGFSFPLFENRNKVKIAEAQALRIDLLRDNAALQAASELDRLYGEAKALHASMEEYSRTFQSQQDLKLLKQALTGGQISMIEYFVEVSVLFQSHQNYLQLENLYQKAMARVYKNNL